MWENHVKILRFWYWRFILERAITITYFWFWLVNQIDFPGVRKKTFWRRTWMIYFTIFHQVCRPFFFITGHQKIPVEHVITRNSPQPALGTLYPSNDLGHQPQFVPTPDNLNDQETSSRSSQFFHFGLGYLRLFPLQLHLPIDFVEHSGRTLALWWVDHHSLQIPQSWPRFSNHYVLLLHWRHCLWSVSIHCPKRCDSDDRKTGIFKKYVLFTVSKIFGF